MANVGADFEVFRATRNRVLGATYILGAAVLIVATSLPHVGVRSVAIAIALSILFAFIGIRLIVTSKIEITIGQVVFRNKWGRQIKIPREQIRTVEIGTRNFMYDRSFPRMLLQSGVVINLYFFEQATSRANSIDSLVRRLIDVLAPPKSADNGRSL